MLLQLVKGLLEQEFAFLLEKQVSRLQELEGGALERLGQEEDTVVLELAAGSYSFRVGAG